MIASRSASSSLTRSKKSSTIFSFTSLSYYSLSAAFCSAVDPFPLPASPAPFAALADSFF